MAPCFARSLKLLYFPAPKNAGTSIRACLFEIENGFRYRDMIIDGNVVQLMHLFGQPTPFVPLHNTEGLTKIAVTRDPWRRLISVYRNRVLFYGEASRSALVQYSVRPDLPEKPSLRTFVENLAEYRKIPQIHHHTNPQVHFLGDDPGYYDRLFSVENLHHLEAFLSQCTDRPIMLPNLRRDGPNVPSGDGDALDLHRLVSKWYEADYKFIGSAKANSELRSVSVRKAGRR